MQLMKNLTAITDLTLYTGNFGKSGCRCNCPGCTQTNYGKRNLFSRHQGTIEQISEILQTLPNLKNAYFLGNPDCSTDPKFCNKASKLFVENGKNVMFSTSGIGGVPVLKLIFDELDIHSIKYVSFSIDSMNNSIETLLKGKTFPISSVISGIEYCLNLNIPVKIQPTIWQINQDSYKEIINFFSSNYGIKWFTFHVGSLEGVKNNFSSICHHVKPDKWILISEKLNSIALEKNIRMQIPFVFLEENNYYNYLKDFKPYCMHKNSGLQIWMEKDLRGTFCPILGDLYPNTYSFDIATGSKYVNFNKSTICPAIKFLLGSELFSEFYKNKWISKTGKTFYPVCRFHSKKINY